MSSIEAFRSSINKYTDFARNSRFSVLIPSGATELLSFRCEDAELPGRSFSTFEARTYGPFIKYPALTSYNEMNLTFLCSGNQVGSVNTGLIEKRFFDGWMNSIQTPKLASPQLTSWNFSYKEEYTRDVTIVHYDVVGDSSTVGINQTASKGRISYAVKLINAFPTSVNQIGLSWGNDEISRLVVTIAYDYWDSIPESNIGGLELSQSSISTQIPRNNTNSLQANRAELRTLTERLARQNAQQTPVPGGAPT